MIVNKRTDKLKVSLKDTDGNDVGVENGRVKTINFDPNALGILSDMLKELKKMNMHLAIQNDIIIEDKDLP